jgi:dTDP-4-dehydrorhamnose 3,5-epimerase
MSDSSPSIIRGGLATDERGTVRFVNDFNPKFYGVRRFYTIENHQVGYVRAWHGHRKEAKFITVLSGAAIIGVANMESRETQKFVMSADNPQILYVPPGYANGSMSLVPNTQIIHFSTCTMEEAADDDIRYALRQFDDIWRIEPR